MTKELKLIPPSDPRVQSAIAPFVEDTLKEHGFKDRKELADAMFSAMKKYGGVGLTCNQVGLPFNMFVVGDHLQIENGIKMACFNPMIISSSEETVVMKEGCLTFPFVFLSITRPRKVTLKYYHKLLKDRIQADDRHDTWGSFQYKNWWYDLNLFIDEDDSAVRDCIYNVEINSNGDLQTGEDYLVITEPDGKIIT